MKPDNGTPSGQERQALRDWLETHGMSQSEAAQLTAPGQTRKVWSANLRAHLKQYNRQQAKPK